MAAPSAEVIGADLSLGMILEAPDDFPRAVMDAARLAFEKHSFDVIILAFVLFHLPEPILALKEAARVLRGGGSIGTLTWGTVPGYPALEIWNETLDAAEAAPMDGLSRHYLVDSPEKMRAMLELADFVSVKTWTRRFEHRQSLEEFLAHRTGHGASRRRLDSLPARVQKTCIETARSRLIELTPEDFTDRSDVVYTVAATPGKH
jgi:ubiquinone/menaquinone biosynthesis C-methylase UbiE